MRRNLALFTLWLWGFLILLSHYLSGNALLVFQLPVALLPESVLYSGQLPRFPELAIMGLILCELTGIAALGVAAWIRKECAYYVSFVGLGFGFFVLLVRFNCWTLDKPLRLLALWNPLVSGAVVLGAYLVITIGSAVSAFRLGRQGRNLRPWRIGLVVFFLISVIPATGMRTPAFFQVRHYQGELAPARTYYALWGYINRSKDFVIKPQFRDAGPFSEGFAVVGIEGNPLREGYIDKSGRIVLELVAGLGAFQEGLASFMRDGQRYGFINTSGEVVVPPQFDRTGGFSEGLANVEIGGKWGYINREGQIVVGLRFEWAEPFQEGVAIVSIVRPVVSCRKSSRASGLINKEGKFVVDPVFDRIESFQEGLAVVSLDGKDGYIDATGLIAISPQFDQAKLGSHLSIHYSLTVRWER